MYEQKEQKVQQKRTIKVPQLQQQPHTLQLAQELTIVAPWIYDLNLAQCTLRSSTLAPYTTRCAAPHPPSVSAAFVANTLVYTAIEQAMMGEVGVVYVANCHGKGHADARFSGDFGNLSLTNTPALTRCAYNLFEWVVFFVLL